MKFKYWIFKINLKDYSMVIVCYVINFYLYLYFNLWIFLVFFIRVYIFKKYEILLKVNYMTLDFKLYWYIVLYIVNIKIVYGCIINDVL